MRRLLVSLLLLSVAACVAPPRGGGVRPAPPGPFDAVRAMWGDYSGMCPAHYDYCAAQRRSLCCPNWRGCCEDASGPYCCSASPPPPPPGGYYGERQEYDRGEYERDYGGGSQSGCDARDIMCSQGGRTICCPQRSRCCAGADGPYCCDDDRSAPPPRY